MSNINLPKTLSQIGMKQGCKAGFYLSLVYNLAFPVIWFYTAPSHQIQKPDISYLLAGMLIMPIYGLVVGCLPATIVGGITGWLVGKAFSLVPNKLTLIQGLLMGLGVTVVIALLLNWFVIFGIRQPSSLFWSLPYLIYFGFPSIIYVIASPVISFSLYRNNKL